MIGGGEKVSRTQCLICREGNWSGISARASSTLYAGSWLARMKVLISSESFRGSLNLYYHLTFSDSPPSVARLLIMHSNSTSRKHWLSPNLWQITRGEKLGPELLSSGKFKWGEGGKMIVHHCGQYSCTILEQPWCSYADCPTLPYEMTDSVLVVDPGQTILSTQGLGFYVRYVPIEEGRREIGNGIEKRGTESTSGMR
nr:hypothetical protein Iba_chr15fCG1630 [Ipomoea batatas]